MPFIPPSSLASLQRDLADVYGFQYWWPADSPQEVMEGAILAQNTSWKNVEKAIARLKGKKASDILSCQDLGEKIRSAGFYRQKERFLKGVLNYYVSKIENLSLPIDTRLELLELDGVGRETADSIALYAFHQHTIPVDSYTIRLLNRYFGTSYSARDYEEIRGKLIGIFNQEQLMEVHGLIDEHCKMFCKKVPKCESCPIRKKCRMNI